MANRILLADDSITIQKVVNLTFADEGIEVVAVSNGDQAERRLSEVQPDLVLADIFMPGKNGYELCEAIKESGQFHHIPVVLLVGAFEPFDQAEARRVKADAHLTKPFESRTLVDTVRRLISASGQPRTGPLPPLPAPDAKAEPGIPTPPAPQMPAQAAPPTEPRPAMTQPFNFDMNAAANPVAPTTPPMIAATTPLNFNYGSSEDPLAVPIEVQVGGAPGGDTAFAPQGHVLGRTDDLSFADNQTPFEPLGLDDIFNEPAAGYDAQSGAARDSQMHNEAGGPENGVGIPSAFGYATEEMLLDLDQPAPAVTRGAQEPFAFDIEEREAASIDASGIQSDALAGVSAHGQGAPPTTLLEAPPSTAPVEVAIDTNPLAMPAAPPVSESHEAVYAAPSVDPSVLFSADDPLGDVLNEGPVEAAPVAPFDDEPQAGTTVTEVVMPQQAPAASNDSPMDYAVEFPAEPLVAPTSEPLAGAVAFEMNAPEADPMPASETGFGFMQVEADQATPRAAENSFTTASMWTAEDARFAAIDIEATPVAEAQEGAASEAPAEAAADAVEDNASPYITQPERPAVQAAPVETAVAAPPVEKRVEEPVKEMPASAPAVQESPAPSAAVGSELTPALIDEIVRRVVAKMSESVVREIAWEVVPDCVERVIKEMTAQEVAKH